MSDRVVVIIPTYDERENLPLVLDRLRAAQPTVHVLIVDDASPDGTGRIADERAAADDRIEVLHRSGKGGLGTAYVAGFEWALRRGFDVIVEMDADGSHAPEQVGRLLDPIGYADLVIGSRYVAGGSVINWPTRRLLLSRAANGYARVALGAGISDITAGFRAYRASALRAIDLGDVSSQGYCFQVDLAWRIHQAGLTVVEVPITFTERTLGASKMDTAVVREAMVSIARWGAQYRLGQLRTLLSGRARGARRTHRS